MVVNLESSPKSTPPYVAWKTLWTFIDELRAKGHTPQVMDNAVLGNNRSGGVRSQLLVALRFFDLIDDDRLVTENLDHLVLGQDPKGELRGLLEAHYGPVIDLELGTATPTQLNETLAEMGAGQGETLRKTARFFLAAAEEAGLPLGPFLKKATSGTGSGSRPAKRKASKRKASKRGVSPRAEARDTPPGKTQVEGARQRYLDMLMEKAQGQEQLDPDLLDRIETLLGYREAPKE